jgi:hypothetical protein
MSTIPIVDEVAAAIDAAHERQVELPRSHLGASQLGHACDRWLWLSFRWAVREPFPGRILRLFRRGRMEEATIAEDLKAIGIDIHSTEGAQARVDFGSHVSGSLDGIIESGVPGAPKARHIFEAKTHSKKSFDDLVKHGVEKSKPVHAAQMQVYMHGTNIDRALYFAVCKDDDRIYTERLRYSRTEAERLIARGHRIALADRMPEPLSSNPSWYECKFCAGHDFCHGSKKTKEVNCRTCAHSTAEPDSSWTCARFDRSVIPIETQYTGCESHVLHPNLVPWQRLDGPDAWTAIYVIDGQEVANGEGDANVYASRELLNAP